MKSALDALVEALEANTWALPQSTGEERESNASQPRTVPALAAPRFDASGADKLAPCGFPDCAGCYDLGDGRRIHPLKCGQEFLRWRAWLEGKGPRQ